MNKSGVVVERAPWSAPWSMVIERMGIYCLLEHTDADNRAVDSEPSSEDTWIVPTDLDSQKRLTSQRKCI